jgi:cytochrome c peroxidase
MDKRFSLDKDISCNTCHDLANFGVDNEPTSSGHKAQLGGRNSPSVYNAALLATQFWDGRAADVEAQALGPVLNPIEMAMPSEAEVVKRIKENQDYVAMFKAAFKDDQDPVTFQNFGKAIGAFERTLLTPGRFDQYLKGDDQALTAAELKGLITFRDTGCTSCHMGSTLGGQMFQKIGLVKPYQTKDLGRYEITKNETDKFVFRVPSLRNVSKTAPYFHDGSVKTLEEAIVLMGRHQLGKELTGEQVSDIAVFLATLTGNTSKP